MCACLFAYYLLCGFGRVGLECMDEWEGWMDGKGICFGWVCVVWMVDGG
jgi:hypothetical protein